VAVDPQTRTTPDVPPKLRGTLTRYRVMAYVVGVMLLVLVFVAVPLRYAAGVPEVSKVVSPIHGFLYIVYLVAAFDLALKARWTAKGTVLVLLAGVVPFLSFWAERRVSARVRAGEPL
jgi:integral membrane protein